MLQEFSRRLHHQVRDDDVVGRWGGEEFLVILIESDPNSLGALAERIRRAVADEPFEYHQRLMAITISEGYASGPPGDTDELLRRADTTKPKKQAETRPKPQPAVRT